MTSDPTKTKAKKMERRSTFSSAKPNKMILTTDPAKKLLKDTPSSWLPEKITTKTWQRCQSIHQRKHDGKASTNKTNGGKASVNVEEQQQQSIHKIWRSFRTVAPIRPSETKWATDAKLIVTKATIIRDENDREWSESVLQYGKRKRSG